jgi:hypothetical protein
MTRTIVVTERFMESDMRQIHRLIDREEIPIFPACAVFTPSSWFMLLRCRSPCALRVATRAAILRKRPVLVVAAPPEARFVAPLGARSSHV